MRKQIKTMLIGILAAILFVSISGAAFAYLQRDEIAIKKTQQKASVEICSSTQSEESEMLYPGKATHEEYYIKNMGKEACYVRIKLIVPEVNGKPLFQVGKLIGDIFIENDFSGPYAGDIRAKKEFWQRDGDYIYYRNEATGNQLHKRAETTEIYGAVRLNAEITNEEILMQDSDVQGISIYAECVEVGSGDEAAAWATLSNK